MAGRAFGNVSNPLRIITVVGARPQFVKAAPVSQAICSRRAMGESIEEKLVHSGQHYDYEMSAVFFDELGLPEPAYHLEVGSASHASQTGTMMQRLEPVLSNDPPDVLMLYGDTNTTLAAALVAAKLQVPIAHVEAGLRSHRRDMAEEVNRVVTDRLADLLFCPSETSSSNLATEGITAGVEVVGDVMLDILSWWVAGGAHDGHVLDRFDLAGRHYAVATIHRAENSDDPVRLAGIIEGIERLGEAGLRVVVPLHPRIRSRLTDWNGTARVKVVEPIGYRDMMALVAGSTVVLTDSGGLQKEAYWLGTPCVTMRDETEWVETVDVGWNALVGADPTRIVEAALSSDVVRARERPSLYGTGHASEAIVSHLVKRFGHRGGRPHTPGTTPARRAPS